MLHRLSLRVLPQLNLLVTDQAVRKRKRLVMLVPGLVAFAIYRLLKDVLPLSDPLVLLVFSGSVSALAAMWAYRQGRGISLLASFRIDGWHHWAWLIGWVGVAYGMQLSLLVLAILQVFVGYDFLIHPEGPAMMAIIIPCTSVTRDAFEIGVVKLLAQEGTVIPTYPNGDALWKWIRQQGTHLTKWGILAVVGGSLGSLMLAGVSGYSWQPILQSSVVPIVVASLSMLAFFSGEALYKQKGPRKTHTWLSCVWFWVWPSYTFALTYFLVLIGLTSYVFRVEQIAPFGFATMAAGSGLVMTLYSMYLGWRKSYEEQLITIPENIQRCPFVMGMLQQAKPQEPVPPMLPQGDLVK